MTSTEFKMRAEARLDEAVHGAGLADPRVPLRARLRELKESHPAAFDQARSHYEQTVLPALAEAADPLAAWVDYACFLAQLTSTGRLVGIDATGRATAFQAASPGLLVLFIPDDTPAAVLVALAPAQPSAAQQATVDLLVNRRLGL